jgi:hypothetical protein
MDNRAKTSKDNLGAYTQSKWRLGKTTAIRVPGVLKNCLLNIAKYLDNSELSESFEEDIFEDVQNYKVYKERSIKYKNRLIELRSEKKLLLKEKGGSSVPQGLEEILEDLRFAILPKSEGGGYDGRKSKELQERVANAIARLEKL